MTLQSWLSLSYPIMQAPMAGASNADFVAKACNLGVLGSLGAGMMSPQQIDDEINQIKSKTQRAFNVNLMILEDSLSQQYDGDVPDWLGRLYEELGLTPVLDKTPAHAFGEQFEVLLTNPVAVASFTFGVLDKSQVERLHEVGTKVIGTANQVSEVLAWQAVGADAVVVQGVEAGGHQGGWLDEHGKNLSALTLLQDARRVSDLPLIGAGGIATSDDVRRMLDGGADLVAVGTAFLTTKESPISPLWKNRLLSACAHDTRLTRLYSGKWARGVVTDYMERFLELEQGDLPSYPSLNAMTKLLRAHGAKTGNSELMSLWAGMGVGECRDETMAELIDRLSQLI